MLSSLLLGQTGHDRCTGELDGGQVNGLRLRADKPRRALPPLVESRPVHHRHNLLKRGATVLVVSAVAVAGFSAFTASSTNATGTAFADSGALAISSIAALEVATAQQQSPSIEDLATARDEQLASDGDEVTSSQQNAAADARDSALSGQADTIAAEVERLRTLSKFMWPAKGGVGSPFGMRLHPILHYYRMHDGDDIGGACGEPIWAAQSGTVIKAETGYNGGSGNNVWIEHGDINGVDVQSGYLHMQRYTVSVGQKVNKGDVIGYVGSTGLSTACHLHFSIRKNGVQSDPMQYIGWNQQPGKGNDNIEG